MDRREFLKAIGVLPAVPAALAIGQLLPARPCQPRSWRWSRSHYVCGVDLAGGTDQSFHRWCKVTDGGDVVFVDGEEMKTWT